MKKHLIAIVAALAALTFAVPALAADGTTTTGGTTVTDGVATLVANVGNTPTTDDFSTASVPVPAGLTFGQITQLAAEYNVTDDDCGAGSPRFQIAVGGKNVFVYLGPLPSFTGCAKNTWLSTGNLAASTEPRVDTSQFSGGKFNSTWAEAVALLGSQAVQGVTFVVDSSWNSATQTNPAFTDKEQTVLLRNVKLNDKTFLVPSTPAKPKPTKVNAAKLCKAQQAAMGRTAFNELWSTNGSSNGFGKCVSSIAKAKKAHASQEAILAAVEACKAKGLKGAPLGSCVAARDRVTATQTEAAEHKKKAKKTRG